MTTEELLEEIMNEQTNQFKLLERILDEIEKVKRNTLPEE